MKPDNHHVRRQDRLLDTAAAQRLLDSAEYGVLSLVTPAGEPYGIPINFVWNKGDDIYFHCATEGRKLDCIRHCSRASLAIVGKTCVIPEQFATAYESIIVTGTIASVLDAGEHLAALERLVAKYAPGHTAEGRKYAVAAQSRVAILRMTIASLSGKARATH